MNLDRDVLRVASVVVLGAIMSILDTTIVNVALDTLGRTFHASLSSVQWASTGYLLSLAIVIPLTGWASDRFGAKRVWMTSMVMFTIGSALCGLAWSLGSLIFFRVLQGLGGGMIMPVGQAILARVAGPARMGRVMSIIGIPMMLGPILGPVLGGLILSQASWRWIFFVNVPVGVVALVLAQRRLRQAQPNHLERLDWLGFGLLSPGLALLVFGLSQIGSHGGLTGGPTLTGLIGGASLIAAFVVHSARRGSSALIDVALFRARSFAASAGTTFLLSISLFGAMLLMPLYYQIVRHQGTLSTGLLMAPQGIGAGLALPITGRLTDRIGAGRVVPFSLAFAVAGTFAFTQLGADTPYWLLAGALFVRGIGLGGSMMPSASSAYQSIPREAISRATASMNIVRQVGASIGTALLAVVLERRIRAELPGAGQAHGLAALHALSPGAGSHATTLLAHAFSSAFWLAFALTALAYVPALLLPRKPPARREAALPVEA